MMLRIAAVSLGAVLVLPQLAAAQSLSFSSKDSDKPITVTAKEGLEWRQTEKQFVARGDAKAVQDETEVTADQLVAHYREKPGSTGEESGSEVYRVDAVGHVIVKSKNETATGDAAVYDFDRKVLVMQGEQVNLVTGDGNVTAHKTLQYWSDQNVAVAEGDAVAVDTTPGNAGRRIRADRLTAFFRDAGDKKGAAKGRDLIFLQGAGNVVLTTKTEIVRGDRADYNLDTGMATVEGGVKMTRDKNQLNGGYAVVNVKGGVSRLYGSAAEAKGAPGAGAAPPARVRALLAPNNKSTDNAPMPQGNTR